LFTKEEGNGQKKKKGCGWGTPSRGGCLGGDNLESECAEKPITRKGAEEQARQEVLSLPGGNKKINLLDRHPKKKPANQLTTEVWGKRPSCNNLAQESSWGCKTIMC